MHASGVCQDACAKSQYRASERERGGGGGGVDLSIRVLEKVGNRATLHAGQHQPEAAALQEAG